MSNQVTLKAIAEIAEVSLVQLIGFVNQHMDKYPAQFTPPLDGKASLHLEYVRQLLNDYEAYQKEQVRTVYEAIFGSAVRCSLSFNNKVLMGFDVAKAPENNEELIVLLEEMLAMLKAPIANIEWSD